MQVSGSIRDGYVKPQTKKDEFTLSSSKNRLFKMWTRNVEGMRNYQKLRMGGHDRTSLRL